ncbi:DedA family protein [Kitasatospora sp. NBC_00315]|uniref:DedA family protein n=1 Tax=Kitasatospora sp. NBC_00315 TaxID=2975963 RepID=UPI003252225C
MTGPLLAVDPTSGSSLLGAFGALAVLVVVFAESGLLVVGFFLPGDTLLLPAGVLCATGGRPGPHLSLWQVMVCAAVGAVAGAQLGFLLGRHGGRTALARSRSARLKAAATRGEELLRRYGYRKTIVLGRFIPMVRTVLSPLAGMLDVPTRTFTVWQVVGGLLWSQSLVLAGYWLGAAVPGIDHYLWLLVGVVVVLSVLPLLFGRRRNSRAG